MPPTIFESIQSVSQKWAPIFRIVILLAISVMAFFVRIFSVIRYESIIHEFDPWFNYRATQYLAKEGLYGLWNWFDSESWYPLGRSIGGTIYPGLMSTSAIIYWILHKLNPPYMCPDGQVLRKESDDYVCGTFVRSKDKPYPIPVSEYPICPSVYSRIANGKPGEKPKYSCYDAYGIKKDLPSFEISRGFQTSLELFPEFQIDKSKFDPYTTYPLNRLQEEDWEN